MKLTSILLPGGVLSTDGDYPFCRVATGTHDIRRLRPAVSPAVRVMITVPFQVNSLEWLTSPTAARLRKVS